MRLVRTLRNLLNIQQDELARRAGISARELSRIEKAVAVPTPETIAGLDAAFTKLLDERARASAA